MENIKLGLEIEFRNGSNMSKYDLARYLSNATDIEVEDQGYNHNTQSVWKLVTDASADLELVSPILKFPQDLPVIKTMLDTLSSIDGVTVNRSCGVHVHVSWLGMEINHVKNIVKRYCDNESKIDAFMPESRRGNMNTYTKSLDDDTYMKNRIADAKNFQQLPSSYHDRFYKVNVTSFAKYGTIEFRHHSGTLDSTKVTNWIYFLVGFCQASKSVAKSFTTNFKAKGRKVFKEIRQQVELAGGKMVWAGNAPDQELGHQGKWNILDANGNVVKTFFNIELDRFYVPNTRTLNQDFISEFGALFPSSAQQLSLFSNVPTDAAKFLKDRAVALSGTQLD